MQLLFLTMIRVPFHAHWLLIKVDVAGFEPASSIVVYNNVYKFVKFYKVIADLAGTLGIEPSQLDLESSSPPWNIGTYKDQIGFEPTVISALQADAFDQTQPLVHN